MATDAEALAAGFILPQGNDMIRDGDNAISGNAKKALDLINAARWYDPKPLSASDHLDNLPSGGRTCWSGPVALAIGSPVEAQFDVNTVRWGVTGGRQTLTTRSLTPEIWQRSQLSGGWVPFVRIYPPEAPALGSGGSGGTRSSGFKTVALSLTGGNGGGSTAPASADVTHFMGWNAPITSFRVCIEDKNPRFGIDRDTSVTLTNVRDAAGTIAANGSFSGMGGRWNSAYMNRPPVGDLSYSYAASAPVVSLVGGGTIDGVATDSMPFSVWIEAETPAGTMVLAVNGDSNGLGVGTTKPVYDSWLSQYCRRIGALPVHYATSGDSLAGWADPLAYKWTRWDHLDKPDMMFLALGSNSMAAPGMTQAQLRGEAGLVADIAASKVTRNLHMITIKPRNGGDATYNGLRRDYNTWIKTKPLGVRDWHDMVTPVSADDISIRPGMFASDGTHMTTAGHAALASSITKTVTIPGGLVFSDAVGRVAYAWDTGSKRMQMVYGDTGLRQLETNAGIGGMAFVRRSGNMVTFYMRDVVLVSSEAILTLPAGFRPDYSPNYGLMGRTGGRVPVMFTIANGVINQNGSLSGTIYATFTFMTNDPWPTSLPGVAVGSIPS